jgi:hypothetical protein
LSTKASSLHLDDLKVESFFPEPEPAFYVMEESGEPCMKAGMQSVKYGSCWTVTNCNLGTCPTYCLWC